MSESRRFYVYVVAIDGRIAYVGKGTGRRSKAHLGRQCQNPILAQAISEARASRLQVKDRIICSGLSEVDALKIERALIVRHHERLTNIALGNRSRWESLLARLQHEWNCLTSDEQTRREGPWNGLSVERRIEIGQYIRQHIAGMMLIARDELGIE